MKTTIPKVTAETVSTIPSIDRQASFWFAKLRADNVTEKERIDFRAWLDENPAHHQAYKDFVEFWQDRDLEQVLQEFPVSRGLDIGNTRLTSRPAAWLALAACLALVAIVWRPALLICQASDYCTGVGEIKTVALSDGSFMTLNPMAAVKVDMTGPLRQVDLLLGEAYFDVKRDSHRPFLVSAEQSTTRVLGTRFSVRKEETRDTVTVVSGLVEVRDRYRHSARLRANQKIDVESSRLGDVAEINGSYATAWQKGKLVFDNVPLREVVTEIARYRGGAIVIGDDDLKSLKVSGRFDIGNTDKILQSLEQTLPIRVLRITPWLVVIS